MRAHGHMDMVWAGGAPVKEDEVLFVEGKILGHLAPWEGKFFWSKL